MFLISKTKRKRKHPRLVIGKSFFRIMTKRFTGGFETASTRLSGPVISVLSAGLRS